ncbi:MAG: STAS domain-containing protein [Clostridia bacterium]|nr:STAS domain-containing protein [Clostridia bacterium]
MIIEKKIINKTLEIALTGRLDTVTAPDLESELTASIDGIEHLVMDFTKLEYISSAGLRVLLSAQKMMNEQGSMEVCHVNDSIREVFDITGFTDVLTIK